MKLVISNRFSKIKTLNAFSEKKNFYAISYEKFLSPKISGYIYVTGNVRNSALPRIGCQSIKLIFRTLPRNSIQCQKTNLRNILHNTLSNDVSNVMWQGTYNSTLISGTKFPIIIAIFVWKWKICYFNCLSKDNNPFWIFFKNCSIQEESIACKHSKTILQRNVENST